MHVDPMQRQVQGVSEILDNQKIQMIKIEVNNGIFPEASNIFLLIEIEG